MVTLFDEIPDDAPRVMGDLHAAEGLARLLELPGIGPKRAVKLADHWLNWNDLSRASAEELDVTVKGHGEELAYAISRCFPSADLPASTRIIGCFDSDWPMWLNDLQDAPVVIYVRGSVPPGNSVGVVGTRRPTEFGRSVVDAVVGSASERDIGVISGLANGIDTWAHQAALKNNLPTWAILGSDVHHPSPKENLDLAEEILDSGGGLLSEQPPGTAPSARTLVARNRLQAAASRWLVAAQCGIPSGTLHTVRFALELGRCIVVPRPKSPWDQEAESAGNLALSDPDGCLPDVIGAKGALAKLVARRRPLADIVLRASNEVSDIWDNG